MKGKESVEPTGRLGPLRDPQEEEEEDMAKPRREPRVQERRVADEKGPDTRFLAHRMRSVRRFTRPSSLVVSSPAH